MHLVKMHKIIHNFKPDVVVIDPITGLAHSGTHNETWSMLLRMVDFLKSKGITALMTTLTRPGPDLESTEVNVSSLMDTWLLLRDVEAGGERNRGIYILKARGLAHSNQIREFHLTSHGVQLRNVYLGQAGVLTGSLRLAQEARDRNEAMLGRQEIEQKQALLERKRKALEAQIAALQMQLESEEQELRQSIAQKEAQITMELREQEDMARSRRAGEKAERARRGGKR
jgi:circadian clock protein KaiC